MNHFRIDFIQGCTTASDYGHSVHSLADSAISRQIISLSLSPQRLQSVSNYTREPRRLRFECYLDPWLQDCLLNPQNEHPRYISHYEIKAYQNNTLFFSGIIDTSSLSRDHASELISITAYDKIRLLTIFSDVKHFYALTAGYMPGWILGYFIQKITQTIPISIPYNGALPLPSYNISPSDPLVIKRIDYAYMLELPLPPYGRSVQVNYDYSYSSPDRGFRHDTLSGSISFCFAHYILLEAPSDHYISLYKARYLGYIIRFFNSVCPLVEVFEKETDWFDNEDNIEDFYADFRTFFQNNGVNPDSLTSLLPSAAADGRSYSQSHLMGSWLDIVCTGNLYPSKLHPGKFYETHLTEHTSSIQALQAMLMLYNATITANAAGIIYLRLKSALPLSTHTIDDADILSMVESRADQELPDTSALDVLAGDTTVLAQEIQNQLIDFYAAKTTCDFTIDNIAKYSINLGDIISVKNSNYHIYEIQTDFQSDEYKVKSWKL
ncbi:MAG: hypothetical protein PHC50_03330 [Candidatus Cloacimonetes bacterium]|nr:hypothetical protein [Candidatus Cloacimonadota bacterium]